MFWNESGDFSFTIIQSVKIGGGSVAAFVSEIPCNVQSASDI